MNSRAKGNRNERVGAGLMTTWTKRKFERTPSSGGLQWKSSFSKGDIVCTKEGHYFPFCVEIKAHKEIDFSHLLNPKVKNIKILEFWAQCKRDATKCNKIPLLMMRYDMMPKEFFFIGVPQEFAKAIHHLLPKDFTSLRYHNYKTNDPIMFLRSDEFFKISYKETKLIAKEYLKPLTHGKKRA